MEQIIDYLGYGVFQTFLGWNIEDNVNILAPHAEKIYNGMSLIQTLEDRAMQMENASSSIAKPSVRKFEQIDIDPELGDLIEIGGSPINSTPEMMYIDASDFEFEETPEMMDIDTHWIEALIDDTPEMMNIDTLLDNAIDDAIYTANGCYDI